MSSKVRIRQWDAPIAVEPGETILEAALSEGVPYPHGCQSGNCGACKSRLLDGAVELAPYSEFALSDAERDEGLILACRAKPQGDCSVAWQELDEVVVHARRVMRCRVAAREAVTHDIYRVRLAIDAGGPFDFAAGQYAAVRFDGQPARDYSMANPPAPGSGVEEIEFHIRAMTGGAASNYVAERLAVGDAAEVEGPFGSSYLRAGHTGPVLAIAGGSGLAPIKSIVETALASGMRQPIFLYFGVRAERDLYLEPHFRALETRHPNFRFVPVLSEPGGATERRTGLVHEAVLNDHEEFDGCKVYLAGPPAMVEAATRELTLCGVRPQDVHADAFYTAAEMAAREAAEAEAPSTLR